MLGQKGETSNLELLVDALQAVDRRIEGTNLVSLQLQLLLEIRHFANVCIALGGVLHLELVLCNRFHSMVTVINEAGITHLELSHGLHDVGIARFLIMEGFLCSRKVVRSGHPQSLSTHQEAPHNQLRAPKTGPQVRLCGE
jgi:hypothetical protein